MSVYEIGYWMFKWDDDSHCYLIPVADRLHFDNLLFEDTNKFNDVFGEYRLNQHPSRYIFKDPQVLEGSE